MPGTRAKGSSNNQLFEATQYLAEATQIQLAVLAAALRSHNITNLEILGLCTA